MKAARQEVELMAFAPVECRAPGADAWLVHPCMWLQPELALGGPPPSALLIERRYELPVPAFASIAPNASSLSLGGARPSGLGGPSGTGFRPAGRNPLDIPPSGLTPLGWDPRALKGANR